jgi:hypothetical protein
MVLQIIQSLAQPFAAVAEGSNGYVAEFAKHAPHKAGSVAMVNA